MSAIVMNWPFVLDPVVRVGRPDEDDEDEIGECTVCGDVCEACEARARRKRREGPAWVASCSSCGALEEASHGGREWLVRVAVAHSAEAHDGLVTSDGWAR